MKEKWMRLMAALVCALLGVLLAFPALAEEIGSQEPVIFLNGQPTESVVLNLSTGSQLQFTSNMPVTWKSSKPYRATIDENGLLTAESASEIVVSATAANGKKAECEVRIERLVTGLTISGPGELAAGKRASLKVSVDPSNADEKRVVWSSSDERVVEVNSSGRITAQKVNGVQTAVITATAKDGSGVFAQHTVTVMPAAKSVSILADGQAAKEISLDISAGQTVQLTASVLPADASQQVAWKSSNAKRVSVDENGVVTAHQTGTATITAEAQDGTGRKATIKVRAVRMAAEIVISGPSGVAAGRTIELEAEVLPKNATERDVVWSSSDPSVVTVNKYGDVKAKNVKGVHTAVITAAAKDGSGVFAQHTVTITPAVQSVQIMADGKAAGEKLTVDLARGTMELDALIQPSEAAQAIVWKSNSTKRAAVDADGVVTLHGTGTATITAYAQDGSGKKASVRLTIVRAVKEIRIAGDLTVTGGKKGELEAVVSPANATNDDVTWESADPKLLSIDKYGRMTAAKVTQRTQVTVYARAKDGSGAVGSAEVTIIPAAGKVTVYSGNKAVDTVGIDLAGSRTLQLTAKVGPEDAQQAVKWTTSSKNRARVDQNGLVTGLKAGKVTITATATDGSGVKAKVTVNVGVMARQIAVTGPAQVTSGQQIALTARVSPKNATEDEVVWSSENESVAKVSKKGVVTGGSVDAPMQVKIIATAKDGGGAVGEYTVTVVPAVRSISIGRTDANMAGTLILSAGGATAKLSASAYPAAAEQKVTWSSSNDSVVRVSSSGVVTSRSAGRAKIIAKATDGSGVKAELWVGVGDLSAIPYYFEVDYANQVVRVYERGKDNTYSKLIRRMICSTGEKDYYGMDFGLYSMNGQRMVWMDGVAIYATRIKGPILFHSVTYTHKSMDALDPVEYGKLGSRASAGCYRLLAADAKWIYDNVPKGCFVNAMRGVRDVKEYGAVTKPALVSGKWDPTNPEPGNPDFDPTYTSVVK